MTNQAIRESLLASDPEFRALAEAHSRCDSKLEQIVKSPYVRDNDLIEEVSLKKRKLLLKDLMESILIRYQRTTSH